MGLLHDGGLTLVLPGSSLAHLQVADAPEVLGLGMSMPEILLEVRKVKAAKRNGVWAACNCKKKRPVFFEKLNTPLEALPAPATT